MHELGKKEKGHEEVDSFFLILLPSLAPLFTISTMFPGTDFLISLVLVAASAWFWWRQDAKGKQ